ncbi:MAG: hypothetical protein ACLFTT_13830 [Candidatus Hydrogenedentota bacterium]
MAISFNRKAVARRVTVFALVVVFSLIAAVFVHYGALKEAALERQCRDMVHHGTMMRIRLNEMLAECRVTRAEASDPVPVASSKNRSETGTLHSFGNSFTLWAA